jgi:hypothetical protein
VVGRFTVAVTLLSAPAAQADVTISAAQTQNMSCSAGVCSPTASSAVLNAGDLETLLASGNVEVTSTGAGVQANNIDVSAALGWSSQHTLELDAYESVAVALPVSVTGTGGLNLLTNDGGSGGMLSFAHKGNVTFQNLSSPLTIDGKKFKLVNSVATLASAIAAHSKGNYALANSYDAGGDGTYTKSPVRTAVRGTVQGLGNVISNITVVGHGLTGGLFHSIGTRNKLGGAVESLGLENAKVESTGGHIYGEAGGMVLVNWGVMVGDHVTGRVISRYAAGGLVGTNQGTIELSYASAYVRGVGFGAGGLVEANGVLGSIAESYATGPVIGPGGGLAAANARAVSNSYALGEVTGRDANAAVGGLLGYLDEDGNVATSYSIGKVSSKGEGAVIGGFIGVDDGLTNSATDCYWDTTTSGTDSGTGEGDVPGLTGLTSKQLESKLPAGFDPSIWAQDKKINNGFPYLIANPPVK